MAGDRPTETLATQRESSRKDRVLTVSITISCQGFQALAIGGLALFLPKIRADLGLSYTQAGVLFSLATLAYALMQMPAGFLADRFGPRRLFFVGSLGMDLLAFAFGWVTAFWMALPILAMAGVLRALMFIPGLLLVASWFPPARRATAMGVYTVGGFLGTVVLSLAGPALAGVYSWRAPFLLFSSIGILASLAYLRLSKESPASRRSEPIDVNDLVALFRYRVMWLAGGIQYIRLAVVFGLQAWVPSYLADEKGVSLPVIGAIVAVSGAITAPSNFLGGYVSDRLKNPPLVIGGALLVLGVTIALLATVNNVAVVVGLIFVTALFQQFYFGPLFSVPVEVLRSRNAGVATGFGNTFANFGALTFGYTVGALKDVSGGFSAGFYALAGCCAVGLVLTVLLARLRSTALRAPVPQPT
ncbi:MAG: MFS transporter [Chloroflexi bacterium]|nr:MFS transporter [Chloroflexota bacterium]